MNNADTLALFYTAYEYSCLNKNEEAKEYYNKVLEQCPDYSWAYFNLAAIAYQEGKRQDAFELIQQTLDYNPKDIEAYKFGAKILSEAGNFDNAQLFIEHALNECENDGNLYYILGQINKMQKNPEYSQFTAQARISAHSSSTASRNQSTLISSQISSTQSHINSTREPTLQSSILNNNDIQEENEKQIEDESQNQNENQNQNEEAQVQQELGNEMKEVLSVQIKF